MLLCATTPCLTSHCPLVTNCCPLPPFFNTPGYQTEGLSKYSETFSVPEASNRNIKPHNRQHMNSYICTVSKTHPSPHSPFPHANMSSYRHTDQLLTSRAFFQMLVQGKTLHIYTHAYTHTHLYDRPSLNTRRLLIIQKYTRNISESFLCMTIQPLSKGTISTINSLLSTQEAHLLLSNYKTKPTTKKQPKSPIQTSKQKKTTTKTNHQPKKPT